MFAILHQEIFRFVPNNYVSLDTWITDMFVHFSFICFFFQLLFCRKGQKSEVFICFHLRNRIPLSDHSEHTFTVYRFNQQFPLSRSNQRVNEKNLKHLTTKSLSNEFLIEQKKL